MKTTINTSLLLLLSLCTAPMHAMQVEDDEVTPEMREEVDKFIAAYNISSALNAKSYATVKQLLVGRTDPNSTLLVNWAYDYLVHLHAQHNNYTEAHEALTQTLANNSTQPKIPLLYFPIIHRDDKTLSLLLQYGANPHPKCDEHPYYPPLYHAAKNAYYKTIQLLLAYNTDPNYCTLDRCIVENDEAVAPLDAVLFYIKCLADGENPQIYGSIEPKAESAKLLLAHGAQAHGPHFRDLPYHKLCSLIWKAEDPNLSDEQAHEKQQHFTLNHWNIRNPAQFILDRRMGLVRGRPRCKCWDVVESLDDAR